MFFLILLLCHLAAAHAADADALLQLRTLSPSNGLSTWQAGTDPCGGAASCSLGNCPWQHVACEQHQVTHVDLSGLNLQGEFPAGWQAPASLKALDLSNNKQLCGNLPNTLVRSAGTTVEAADSGIGQPCAQSKGPVDPATSSTGKEAGGAGAPMSNLARGLLGAGVGLGVLAGAAVGSLFFLTRKRRGSKEQPLDDLARVHDSVTVTKQQHKRVKSALDSCGPDAGPAASSPEAIKSPRQSPELRMVAFAEGSGCALGEDDKQRLRADNIQDSVVIMRHKLESGHLFAQQHEHGSNHSNSRCSSQCDSHHRMCADEECGGARVHDAAAPVGLEGGNSHLGHVQEHAAEEQRQLQPSASKRVQFDSTVPLAN